MSETLRETQIPNTRLFKRGKVRDIYEADGYLLIIATDRVSAFDVVLPDPIPYKGQVLTMLSLYWFQKMGDIIENHVVTARVEDYPEIFLRYKDILQGRSMLVKKAKPLPVECIVRGYLSGSAWKEYEEHGTICGIELPLNLAQSSRLPEPIFTPTTKAEEGHDLNITFDQMCKIVGKDMAILMKEKSLEIYKKAEKIAEKKGIIIADTKMEFGLYDGRLILIDELLTPDSSRFWSKDGYVPGKSQESYDKQIIRDYLISIGWDKKSSAPSLPYEIVRKTSERYKEIARILIE